MKALIFIGILALGMAACSDNAEPQKAGNQQSQKPQHPTALTKSNSPSRSIQRPPSRAFDESKATAEQLAAKRRLEERLEQAAIDREKEDARRAEERVKRAAQMLEQISTRLREGDANGDGFLSQEEVPGPMARRFADSDANGDGLLDAAEQQAMLESLSERMRGAGGFGGGLGDGGGRDRRGRGRDRN